MMRYVLPLTVLIFLSCAYFSGLDKTEVPNQTGKFEEKDAITSMGPKATITRNILQDSSGNVWLATFTGVYKYDGKTFTNITREVSSARFFSILEDRSGNLWFGSIGAGVYQYDGKSFRNITTKEGLADDRVTEIYEDNLGNIWFGATGGVSRFDGKSLDNFTIEDWIPNNDDNNVWSILEDRTGKFWFGTRENAMVYNGKAFTTLTHNGNPFRNVHTVIEDRNGSIWLGSQFGLWRYDGNAFTNITQNSVGCVYEDKNGNIWTGSKTRGWALCRYDQMTLSSSKPKATIIKLEDRDNMIFGIQQVLDGSIWFGTLLGAYRYDGTLTSKPGSS